MMEAVIAWYPNSKKKNKISIASIFNTLISDKTRSVEDDCRSR